MRQPILILALDGGFGGSINLMRALNAHSAKWQATLVTSRPSPYGFGEGVDAVKNVAQAAALIDAAERVWVCDCGGLLTLARHMAARGAKGVTWEPGMPTSKPVYEWLRKRSLIFYWSGSAYRDRFAHMNLTVDGLPCRRRYAMCDLTRCDRKALPLMQCYEGIVPSAEKYPKFTIGHTPGMKYKKGNILKGTPAIIGALDPLKRKYPKLTYFVLQNMPHAEALAAKSKCHAFVDQIVPAVGGIGKSGLEALLMGIPTLCDVGMSRFTGYYADAPVLHVGKASDLYREAERLFLDRGRCAAIGAKASDWSRRLHFAPTAAYLDQTMEWA